MTDLRSLIPDADQLVQLETPDLAGYVLECLLSQPANERSVWNRRNFCIYAGREFVSNDGSPHFAVSVACSAAWSWLEANGFICRHPEQDNEWFVPTASGEALRTRQALQALVAGELLPTSFLHPSLLTNARPLFLQSRFDTAVFESFKALEVAIRAAGSFGADVVGVQLAEKAFHPEDGALTDRGAEKGERVALMKLMSGAIGSHRNSVSHRHVGLHAEEARDMIILASHLLRIVDTRHRHEANPAN
jgi:uncharacterized protein (TIGR02391 family)